MAVVLFMGSMNATKIDNKSYVIDDASCFEQANHFATWMNSVVPMTGFQTIQLVLDYTATCEG